MDIRNNRTTIYNTNAGPAGPQRPIRPGDMANTNFRNAPPPPGPSATVNRAAPPTTLSKIGGALSRAGRFAGVGALGGAIVNGGMRSYRDTQDGTRERVQDSLGATTGVGRTAANALRIGANVGNSMLSMVGAGDIAGRVGKFIGTTFYDAHNKQTPGVYAAPATTSPALAPERAPATTSPALAPERAPATTSSALAPEQTPVGANASSLRPDVWNDQTLAANRSRLGAINIMPSPKVDSVADEMQSTLRNTRSAAAGEARSGTRPGWAIPDEAVRAINNRYDALAKEMRGTFKGNGMGNLMKHLTILEANRGDELSGHARTGVDRANNRDTNRTSLRSNGMNAEVDVVGKMADIQEEQAKTSALRANADAEFMSSSITANDKRQDELQKEAFTRTNDLISTFAQGDPEQTAALTQYALGIDPDFLSAVSDMDPSVQGKYISDLVAMYESKNAGDVNGIFQWGPNPEDSGRPRFPSVNADGNPLPIDRTIGDVFKYGLWDTLRSNARAKDGVPMQLNKKSVDAQEAIKNLGIFGAQLRNRRVE